MLPAVKPRGARGLKQLSGNTLHKMVRSNHDRTTSTCSDRSRSLRYRNTRKSLDVMPRLCLVWRIWLSKPIRQSRRADSNRLPLLQLRVITQALLGVAGVCKRRVTTRYFVPWFAHYCGHCVRVRVKLESSILDGYSHWIPSMRRHAADGMGEALG